ncbi:MAG: hypothetical protein HQL71_02800, partial [Magnetococcales bacterium]|nr:hypothetical protein [Magnetococcales bacterium]
TIEGVPEGATLSNGVDNGDGSWSLDANDLEGLSITPAANSDEDFSLNVSVTSSENSHGNNRNHENHDNNGKHNGNNSEGSTVTGVINVSVAADADAPTLTLESASGVEDSAISLDIASGLTDTDGSESLSITIEGVPTGATLSNGTNNGDGTWTLGAEDLADLSVTPANNSDEDFTLTVTASSTEANGGDTAFTTQTIDVAVTSVNDAPEITGETTGLAVEDDVQVITGSLSITDADSGESSFVAETITSSKGSLTIDSSGEWTYTLNNSSAQSMYDGEVATDVIEVTSADGTTQPINISIVGTIDSPTLTVTDHVTGDENSEIALDISSALTDVGGSGVLSIIVDDVPEGATLSAGSQNSDNSWTLSVDDLEGLTITPEQNSDEDFTISVSASYEENGKTATTTATIDVTVDDTNSGDTINGTNGSNWISGTNDDDTINGNGGHDIIFGRDGDDVINGNDGHDIILGNDGDDLIKGGDGHDYISGGNGNDTMHGDDGNDRIIGRDGDDTIYGGDGNDHLDGNDGNDHLDGNDGNDTLHGHDGNDTINGNDGNDRIEGGRGDDVITGGDGNDRIVAGKGDDTILGGDGNDRINAGEGNDIIDGGSNHDTLELSGKIDDYNVAENVDGTFTIIDTRGNDGVDIISNIEALSFKDGNLNLSDAVNQVVIDPIVIDLNGDGIGLSTPTEGLSFNMSPDGQQQAVGWISSGDGFLVIDRNDNGQVDDITEMFSEFYQPGVNTGLGALSTLDENGDSVLNAQDSGFANLQIWQDQNSDGQTDPGEMQSLSAHSITEINLSVEQVNEWSDSGVVLSEGSVTYENGDESAFGEVGLTVENAIDEIVEETSSEDILSTFGDGEGVQVEVTQLTVEIEPPQPVEVSDTTYLSTSTTDTTNLDDSASGSEVMSAFMSGDGIRIEVKEEEFVQRFADDDTSVETSATGDDDEVEQENDFYVSGDDDSSDGDVTAWVAPDDGSDTNLDHDVDPSVF